MSDTSANEGALDPQRPWITDPEQLPSKMDWFGTFLNPTGKSSKLHFTRAWTVLFFAGLIGWLGLAILFGVVGATGVDSSSLSTFHAYFLFVLFAVTAVLSYIIHARRLNHAGKSPLWSLIVLIPLILGTLSFLSSVQSSAAKYDEMYDARAEYLKDPEGWRQDRLNEQREAQAKMKKAREEAEAAKADGEDGAEGGERSGPPQGQRGGRGGGWNSGPSADDPLPTQEAFIVRPNLSSFYGTIVGLNFFVMFWSLLWVARTPFPNRKKSKVGPFDEVGQTTGAFD